MNSLKACWVAFLRLDSAISVRPCGFAVHRSPTFSGRGSSSLELFVPFSVLLQPPAFHACRASTLRWVPGLRESASLGVFTLFATSVEAARTWAPTPPSGFFPGLPRFKPALSDAPSSAFCTPSTVSSASALRAYFIPLPRTGFHSPGVFPSLGAVPAFAGRCPRVVPPSVLRFDPRRSGGCRLQGLAPQVNAVARRDW